MNKKEFLKESENVTKEDLKQFKDDMLFHTTKVNDFDKDKNLDWSNTKAFQMIKKGLGLTPPIKLLKDLLSYYQEERQKILKNDIPMLMDSIGVKNTTLIDGTKIEIKEEVSAKTLDKESFFLWLKKYKYEDNIKSVLEFPKGEIDKELDSFLADNGYSYKKEDKIHFLTVNRIMKERITNEENGEKKPLSLPKKNVLKVTIFKIAKIK